MYEILVSNYFAKQLKRLAKKNDNLKKRLKTAFFGFDKRLAISMGHGVYKFRVSSENKGKSGGYRVYVYVVEINKILTPIAIYSKHDQANLSFSEMSRHLEEHDKRFDLIEKRLDYLESKMDSNFQLMAGRFDQLEKRIEKLETKVEAIYEKRGTMNIEFSRRVLLGNSVLAGIVAFVATMVTGRYTSP